MRGVLALIFDFDGLILDTETPEFVAWTEVFHSYAVEMPEGYWAGLIGRGVGEAYERPAELLRRLVGDERAPVDVHTQTRELILSRIARQRALPGIEALLDECATEGVPTAVASSSRHDWVDGYLAQLGLSDRFTRVVCSDDVPRGKPYPDLYLEACAQLAMSPGEVVALEDSPNGIAAARAAGVFVFVIPNSVTQELDLSGANHRLETLDGIGLSRLRELRAIHRSASDATV